jgi:quinol monooxygenase YgiN
MIIELISMVTPPEKRQDLGDGLHSFLEMTQEEPGCTSGILYQNWTDPNVLYLEFRWETVSDLIQHIRLDRYKRLLLLMELGAEPPVIEFLTVSEVKGLDFIKAIRMAAV